MRLLLDTQLIVALVNNEGDHAKRRLLDTAAASGNVTVASVASLWEIAIKANLGKLSLRLDLTDIPDTLTLGGMSIMDIDRNHALEKLVVVPPTRDPFDRLLLAQCQVENMRLVTTKSPPERPSACLRP